MRDLAIREPAGAFQIKTAAVARGVELGFAEESASFWLIAAHKEPANAPRHNVAPVVRNSLLHVDPGNHLQSLSTSWLTSVVRHGVGPTGLGATSDASGSDGSGGLNGRRA